MLPLTIASMTPCRSILFPAGSERAQKSWVASSARKNSKPTSPNWMVINKNSLWGLSVSLIPESASLLF